MPTIEIKETNRIKTESIWLNRFANNITSQYGEDGIISKIFDIIPTINKWCLEFGAADGRYMSNTWNLLTNKGWIGCLIEGKQQSFNSLKSYYNSTVICLNIYISINGQNSLDCILDRVNAPIEPDFISIDVDGIDWHIWKSLIKYVPRVIVIEFNPTIPNDVLFIQDDDPKINQGSSLLAMIELGKIKGYELIVATVNNAFFVRNDLFSFFNILDNNIDSMYYSTLCTKIFQCYDGTLYTTGCKRILWAGVDFQQDSLQIIPKEKRRYG